MNLSHTRRNRNEAKETKKKVSKSRNVAAQPPAPSSSSATPQPTTPRGQTQVSPANQPYSPPILSPNDSIFSESVAPSAKDPTPAQSSSLPTNLKEINKRMEDLEKAAPVVVSSQPAAAAPQEAGIDLGQRPPQWFADWMMSNNQQMGLILTDLNDLTWLIDQKLKEINKKIEDLNKAAPAGEVGIDLGQRPPPQWFADWMMSNNQQMGLGLDSTSYIPMLQFQV
nr:agamous-like MADS-box protein AGL80 [Ipomoea batatas]